MAAVIRQPRWALALVVSTGLLLGAAACGSSGTSGKAASADTSLDSLSTADLAAKAAQEGTVTWYTTFADTDVQPIVKAFNQEYPKVTVKPLRLSADQIPARIITEQRGHQYSADVVSGDSPQVAQILQANALQPYTPKDGPALPAGMGMPKGGRSGSPAGADLRAVVRRPGVEGQVLHRPQRGELVRQPRQEHGSRQGAGAAHVAGQQQAGLRGEPHPGADQRAGR
jgi:iron(III) transport system substrate-binding protein